MVLRDDLTATKTIVREKFKVKFADGRSIHFHDQNANEMINLFLFLIEDIPLDSHKKRTND